MESKRKELHKWLRDHKNPKDNEPWTDKTYDQYYSAYFTNKEGVKKLHDFVIKNKIITQDKTLDGFYKKYACGDIEWAKNSSNCKSCKEIDKKYIDKDYDMTLDVEVFRRAKNKGIYYTAYYDCKVDGKKHYFYKLKGDTSSNTDDENTTPSPEPTSYRDCTAGGSYTIGCTDTEGIIKKVQGCIGVTPDGKFGPKTESALYSKVKKNTFTKDEVDGICSGKLDDQGGLKPFGTEEQKAYWEELKNNKQITDRGVIVAIKNGSTITYVYKQNKDTKVKEPVTRQDIDWSTPEKKDALMKNFETYNYVVLYPINPNSPKNALGEVEVITAVIDNNGEQNVGRVKAGTWSPSEKQSSFDDGDLVAETIKKILSRRLVEQNVKLDRESSPKASTTSGNDQASTTTGGRTQTQTNTGYKIDTKKLCSYVNPRRDEAIKILVGLKDMKILGIPLVKDEDKVKLQSSIDQMEKIDCATVCNSENVVMLSDAKSQINAMMETREGKAIEGRLSRLLQLISQIENECNRIKKEQSNYVASPTTISGSNQSSTTSGSQQQTTSSPSSSQTNSIDPEVKEIVESNGYTFDKPSLKDVELLATKTTVGELFKKLDQGGVYKDYYNDNTPIWKSSTMETEKVDVNQLIKTANSANTKREEKRKVCKSAVKQLYYRAFKSKRVIQYKDFKDIDSNTLQGLKDVVIRCDQEKNFVQGDFGVRDELKSLYSCYQQGRDKRESHGVSKYCLTGYLNDVQGTPGMQRESIVKKHILNAINSKKKDVMVESILRQIKNTRR
jgi:hypothetical protein